MPTSRYGVLSGTNSSPYKLLFHEHLTNLLRYLLFIQPSSKGSLTAIAMHLGLAIALHLGLGIYVARYMALGCVCSSCFDEALSRSVFASNPFP
jgi:hypothetical protein